MSLFGSSTGLGLDIGTTTIKLIEISRTAEKKFKLETYGSLENYGHLERPNDAFQTSNLRLVRETTTLLIKELMKQVKPKTNRVVMSVPSFSAFVSLVEFPQLSKKDLLKAIQYESKQYIPVPLLEVEIDFNIITKDTSSSRLLVLLIAILRENIEDLKMVAKGAGLKLEAVELENISLARALSDPLIKEPVMLVDIGTRNTTFTVVERGDTIMIANYDTGGGDFTQVIATGFNIAPRRAEELKKAHGLRPVAGQEELAILLYTLIDNLISEIKRNINLYKSRYNKDINKIYLTGGSANLINLVEYIQKQFQIEVKKIDPFTSGKIIYNPKLESAIRDIGPSFSVACGLAIKELV